MKHLFRAAIAVALVLSLAHPGPSGFRNDASLFIAVQTFADEGKRQPATFVMGGVVFAYTKQDWTNHQDSLADAMTETYLRAAFLTGLPSRKPLTRGYLLLTGHASETTLSAHWRRLQPDYGGSPARLA